MIPAAFDTADAVERLVRARIEEGARFAWLFGETLERASLLHYAIVSDGALEHYAGVVEGSVPSLGDITAAARWHEREAHDCFGIEFGALAPEAPILPPPDPGTLRRSTASEVSTVVYGPVRSGVVESAAWIVETAGEDFIFVTPSMYYKRRNLEAAFGGMDLNAAPLLAEHASGATAASHATAFCRAAERALHAHVPPRAWAARAVMVEFERIHQHLDSLAKLADDGSLSVGSAQTFAAKERVHRLLAEATGSRFSRGTTSIGGTRFDVFGALQSVCARLLNGVERETMAILDILFSTQSLLDRLIGAGRLSTATVKRYGGVGPTARGSGVSCDARVAEPLFTAITADECLETGGDALARALVRREEIVQSFRLIRNALDAAPSGEVAEHARVQNGSGIGRVESPQGELLYFVRFDGGRLAHVAIRSASYQNWPLFPPSLPGNIFTDFSFIEHSLGLIQSEVDR